MAPRVPRLSPKEFFPWLKWKSENLWASFDSNYKNSKWLPGLTESQVADFEKEMGFTFPDIYKLYLKFMNGTTECSYKVSENVVLHGGPDPTDWISAIERSEIHGHLYHSYPRDLYTIRGEIDEVCARFKVKPSELDQREIPHIMPISSGTFLVIDRCEANPVLQIYPDEPVGVCANSLEESLAFNILFRKLDPSTEEAYVKFWVDYDDGIVKCPECGMDAVNPVYSGFWIFKRIIAFSCYNKTCPTRGKPFNLLISPKKEDV